jgi:hypothetical protein
MLKSWGFSVLLGAALAAPAAPPDAPREIVDHYRDYNFVNAFSTARERQTIADDPRPPKDRRLAGVARILDRLASAVDEVDPGILLEMGRRRHESEFRSDLVRVSSFRLDEEKGEAWVHLEVTALDEGVVGMLVAQYDRLTRQGRSIPDADDLLAATPRAMRGVTREVHRWTRVDGVWRRDAAVYLLGL